LTNLLSSGCEPLTPDDIAEVIVFAAGRRENVVIADTLIYPSHQVRILDRQLMINYADCFCHRVVPVPFTASLEDIASSWSFELSIPIE
jgi:hypothetical protein